jgi:hypothetical protein
MLRRLATTTACTTACTIALTLLGSATAQAATRSFVDGPGDVWTLGENPNTRMPNREQGDILRTTFTHTQRAVVVRTKFAELNRKGRRIFVFTRLRTNTGLVRDVSLDAGPRPRTNRWRGTTTLDRRDDTVVDCATAHRIDYAANLAVLRIPRTCLANPRTVQARFGVATTTAQHTFADNPINHGPTDNLPPYTSPVRPR